MELIDHEFNNHILFKEVEGCSLIDSTLNSFLLLCSFDDSFLDGALGNKLIDIYISTLTDSMCSVCGLCIHCWVPVVIIEDDCVGCSQRHSQTT